MTTTPVERRLRLLFWNVFLLRPRLVPGGPPLPSVADMAAPAVGERAERIGEALAGAYDVVALAEAFDPKEQAAVARGWAGRDEVSVLHGPARSFPPSGPAAFAGSGLMTVVDELEVTRVESHVFAARGSRLHDADAWSNKGVLYVEIDPGLGGPRIGVASTHLIWGTGLVGGSRASDPFRRHALRMAQVDELVEFVDRVRRPTDGLVLVGDFNVPAHAVCAPGGPDGWYADLVERLGRLGLVDAWSTSGVGPGPTCNDDVTDLFDGDDPDRPGHLLDDPAGGPDPGPGRERIDYVFVRPPQGGDALSVTHDRPRRRAFPRAAGAPDRHRLPRLSDHLAVTVDLCLRPAGAPDGV